MSPRQDELEREARHRFRAELESLVIDTQTAATRLEGELTRIDRLRRGMAVAVAVAAAAAAAVLAVLVNADVDSRPQPAAPPGVEVPSMDLGAMSPQDRVANISAWAEQRNLLGSDQLAAAVGGRAPQVVDAFNPEVVVDGEEWFGPIPPGFAVMDAEVRYVLQQTGERRVLTRYVNESIAQGPSAGRAFEAIKKAESQRSDSSRWYPPARAGYKSVGFETDGGHGAVDRLVIVRSRGALLVISASTASPNGTEDDLTVRENLTRHQVEAIVEAAVANVS